MNKWHYNSEQRIVAFIGSSKGYDPLFVKDATRQIRATLQETHGECSDIYFSSDQVELAEFLDEINAYSLLASHKLVILDMMPKAGKLPFLTLARKALSNYCESPNPGVTLVIRAPSGWTKGKLDNLIDANGQFIKVPAPSDTSLIARIEESLSAQHGAINRNAANELLRRLNSDPLACINEANKLWMMASARGQTAITIETVTREIGESSDAAFWTVEAKVYEAMLTHQPAILLAELQHLIDQAGHDAVPISNSIIGGIGKLVQLKQSDSSEAICKQLKLFGRNKTLAMQVATQYQQKQLDMLYQAAVYADASGKGLGMSKMRLALEKLAIASTTK